MVQPEGSSEKKGNLSSISIVYILMGHEKIIPRMASMLKRLRHDRGISQNQLAEQAGVNTSVINRAERGNDARLSTWDKLFEALGYRLLFDAVELSEEAGDLLIEEADRRREKRRQGLCVGKRRF